MTAAVYECTVRHVRSAPVRHAFAYRSYLWLLDPDDPPRNRWTAAFLARDHAGDPRRGIGDNVRAFLAAHGVVADGRILMLTTPRVLGRVFNPLTVYWCHRAGGDPAATVAEVHNTYGGRHRYLLRPGDDGLPKAFHVSPFLAVDGSYRISLPLPGDRLALSVRLDHGGGRPFVATLRGRRRPATRRAWLTTLLVPYRIRFQGLRLYARGLPVLPRPAGRPA